MSSQRPSFAKRDREMKLKDKARAKAERRAARRAEVRSGTGPASATDEVGGAAPDSGQDASPTPATPATPAITPPPDRPR